MATHTSLLPQEAAFTNDEQALFDQLLVEAEIEAIVNALFPDALQEDDARART